MVFSSLHFLKQEIDRNDLFCLLPVHTSTSDHLVGLAQNYKLIIICSDPFFNILTTITDSRYVIEILC